MDFNIECRNCKSQNILQLGFTTAQKRRYKCRDCKKTFTPNAMHKGGYPYPLSVKLEALKMIDSNLSYRFVAKTMGINIKSIVLWKRKLEENILV